MLKALDENMSEWCAAGGHDQCGGFYPQRTHSDYGDQGEICGCRCHFESSEESDAGLVEIHHWPEPRRCEYQKSAIHDDIHVVVHHCKFVRHQPFEGPVHRHLCLCGHSWTIEEDDYEQDEEQDDA